MQVVRSFVKFQFSRIAISGEWNRRWPSNVLLWRLLYALFRRYKGCKRVLEKPSQGIDTKKGKIVRSRTRATLFQNELRKNREEMKK